MHMRLAQVYGAGFPRLCDPTGVGPAAGKSVEVAAGGWLDLRAGRAGTAALRGPAHQAHAMVEFVRKALDDLPQVDAPRLDPGQGMSHGHTSFSPGMDPSTDGANGARAGPDKEEI